MRSLDLRPSQVYLNLPLRWSLPPVSGAGRCPQWEVLKARSGRGGGEADCLERPPSSLRVSPALPPPAAMFHASSRRGGAEEGRGDQGGESLLCLGEGGDESWGEQREEEAGAAASEEPALSPAVGLPGATIMVKRKSLRARSKTAAVVSPCPSRPSCGGNQVRGAEGAPRAPRAGGAPGAAWVVVAAAEAAPQLAAPSLRLESKPLQTRLKTRI